MEQLEGLVKKLKEHQRKLDVLMQEVPKVDGFPCKYYLFLTRLDGFTLPFVDLYDRLIEKQSRQIDVFNLFRVDMRSHIYVDVAIREGVAFRRPLRQIVSSFDWVHLALREFIFIFGDPKDHQSLFGDWVVRTTPESFMEASRIMVSDIMRSLIVMAIQTERLTGEFPPAQEAQAFVIDLLRKEIFKAYRKDKRSWEKVKDHVARVNEHMNLYTTDFKEFSCAVTAVERQGHTVHSTSVRDLLSHYQLRGMTERDPKKPVNFYQCGVELEFQTPLRIGNIERFARRLRQEAGMHALSTSPLAGAYANSNGGVLSTDTSLPTLEGYFPTEYASAVMKTKEESTRVARVIRYINQRGCLIDNSAGIHMHISREGLPLKSLQNLVLRFARFEKLIRQCFFNESRYHDMNMYGPSLLSLYGDVKTSFGRTKNFLLMTYFARRSTNIDELFDASSCSGRYASLFLKTKLNTLEFRGHPATLSVNRVMNYFEFIQGFVDGAIKNDKELLSLHRLRKAAQLRKIDKTKCLPDPLYATCSCNKFDASDIPTRIVRKTVKKRFQRVTQKIYETKKTEEPDHNYDGQLSHKPKS